MTDNPERETAGVTAPAVSNDGPPAILQTSGVENLRRNDRLINGTSSDFLQQFVGDPATAHWVVSALDAHGKFVTATFDDSKRAADWISAKNTQACNLYFNPATMRDRLSKKAGKEDVAASEWLWIDVDPAKLHKDAVPTMSKEAIVAHYKAEREKILAAIKTMQPPPSVVIDSGNGFQAFWKLGEPLTDLEQIEGRNRWLGEKIGADHCWNCDRIMRLPGTPNRPDEKKRSAGITWTRMASVVEELSSWAVYSADQFEKMPPPETAPDAGGQLVNFDFDNLPAIGELQSVSGLQSDPGLRHLIEHGHNPGMQPAYRSRSEAVLAATRRMYNVGIEPPMIVAILLDRRFVISESVREKRRGAKDYALRQVQKVLATPNHSRAAVPDDGIQTYDRQMREITADAVNALKKHNDDSPRIFIFAKRMARVSAGEIEVMDDDQIRHELSRAARWYTLGADGPIAIAPPVGIANDILAMRSEDNPLAVLVGTSTVPVIRADGSICAKDGYDPATRTYFTSLSKLGLKTVPDRPTAEDVTAARQLVVEEMLGDFPFVGDADLAHAVALMITPFARDLIDGPVPPKMVEKPTPRTGATLMVQVIAFPALGDFIEGEPWPTEEAEREKTLLSLLLQSPRYIAFDNVNTFMNSAAFSLATTASRYKARLLSQNKMASVDVRCAWVLMANNPKMSREIAMRMGRCRLDARMPDPSTGREFRHPDIRGWVREHRADLIWAALTLIRAWWVTQPRPEGQRVIGMYESYCRVIGGILDNAGIPGLFANREEFLQRAAPDLDAMSIFIGHWWNSFDIKPIRTAALLVLLDENDISLGVNGDNDIARKKSLGRKLEDLEDSQHVIELVGVSDAEHPAGKRKIEVKLIRDGSSRGSVLWRLKLVSPIEPAGEQDAARLVQKIGAVAFTMPEAGASF